ncbi:hypothetical protein Baya_10638 [Bagarius yarrelli]|uniref:Uncharacterized protein n=1 Tax=Bagarius yarrelli TaxID=175774 RepID=A0A556UG12_BAGYA|nr:hypothetical protein Baya_10638 [Bagarius yarrelli]
MEIPFSGFELVFVILALTVFGIFALAAIYTRRQHADNQDPNVVTQENREAARYLAKRTHQYEVLPSALRPVASTHSADFGQRTETRFSEFAEKIQETSLSTQTLPSFTLQSSVSLRLHDTVFKRKEGEVYVLCQSVARVLKQTSWTSRQPTS